MHSVPGGVVPTNAFLDPNDEPQNADRGFPGSQIIVSYNAPEHPKIWASNTVMSEDSQPPNGFISVASRFMDRSSDEGKEQLKEILAQEWLEVMLKLRDSPNKRNKVVSGNESLAIIFAFLGRPALWQDMPLESQLTHAAIRELLVSTESLTEMLDETFDMSPVQLRSLAKEDPNIASKRIRNLVHRFSAKWSVKRELVYDRLHEMLFR